MEKLKLSNEIVGYNESRKFSLASANSIREICSPMFRLLGISGFTFQRMYKNGKRLYFSSSEVWIENFYKKNYFLASGFKKFSQLQTFNLWRHWPKQDKVFHNLMSDARENFNYDNGLVIIRGYESHMDLFTFRGLPEDESLNSRYLSEFSTIENFLEYFIMNSESLINKANRNSFTLSEDMIDLISNSMNTKNVVKIKEEFYKSLNKKIMCCTDTGKRIFFTKRESDCIYFLIRGQTAKEIARSLNLSPRTVECHINSIKSKLGCFSRSKAIELIMENKWNQRILFANIL